MGQVLRRQFLMAASALLAAPAIGRAQVPKRLPVLGLLTPHRKPPPGKLTMVPLRNRLHELGWVDGKTMSLEVAYGEGREDRMPELAARLVSRKVDVIWTLGAEAAVAAARATTSIPIVFWGVAFPIEQGLVDSYAHPGRNVTGVAWTASIEIEGKRLEFLREIAPAAKRLAYMTVPTTLPKVGGGMLNVQSSAIGAAQQLGYEVRVFAVEKQEDFEPAFSAILAWGAQALTVSGTPLTYRARQQLAEFALRNRLPSAFTLKEFVEAGGLLSYAIDWQPTFAKSADFVDRILRGAQPAELPVELPSKYAMTVNLKTAKSLGITIPQSIMLRADRVIE